jgi:hypothetical protein
MDGAKRKRRRDDRFKERRRHRQILALLVL